MSREEPPKKWVVVRGGESRDLTCEERQRRSRLSGGRLQTIGDNGAAYQCSSIARDVRGIGALGAIRAPSRLIADAELGTIYRTDESESADKEHGETW